MLNFGRSFQQDKFINTIEQQQKVFTDALQQLRAGDAEGAASSCTGALQKYPGDANLLCLGARAMIAQRKFEEAGKLLDEAIQLHPDFAVALDVAGDLQMSRGLATSAISAWEQAMRLDPSMLRVVEKIERAEKLKADAEAAPTSQQPQQMPFAEEIAKANEHLKNSEGREAEQILRDILKRDPNHVEAARMLAQIAVGQKEWGDAEIILKHAISVAPDFPRAWAEYANVLREQEKYDEALDATERLLDLAPEAAESYLLKAGVVGAMGDHHGAIDLYKASLEISPERPGVLVSLAHHLKTVGEQEESIATYRRCIELKADHSEAYWSLANLKTFQFEQSEIDAMYELLDSDELADEDRLQIHNALGLDRESRKEYDTAFSHYAACNRLRRDVETYDPVETETRFDRLIDIMTPEFIAERDGKGDPDPAPIFVVGLPRSGSTLIEQILASHSAVDGTHELHNLANEVRRLNRSKSSSETFPESLLSYAPDEWRELGAAYIESTRPYRAGAPYFIDKNPNNFSFVGLLRLALPNAKIINARRHPMDSCFGSFKQLFASGQPFTYDLVEVGEYYLQYVRLMQHWHDVAPGYVLDVQYEQVVADLETQVRRILDFCGLPFEENCLRFHETERAVKTASSEQVRRPIYSSSVNLWKNYESHLGDLIEVLEPLLLELPENDKPAPL